MKKIISLLISCLFVNFGISQIAYPHPSSISIANTSVADAHNWSAFHNPAPLSQLSLPQLEVIYENRYIITELAAKSFTIAYPTKHFVPGFSFTHFGFSLYHEMMLGLAFARDFAGKFSLGMQFTYHSAFFVSTNRYHAAFYPQIGLNIPVHRNLTIGVHLFNPFGTNIKSELSTKRIPSIFSLGCSYHFIPELAWRFQAEKEISSNYRVATGFQYTMLKRTRFQLGIYANDYLVSCLGIGFDLKPFSFDLCSELHPLLGLNTIVRLKYKFDEKP
ncbi:MAG: hypothetical protein Q7J05_07890 [Paludibacter sp.]|nr:hypothetical protein [Paludibacter sp.]